MTSQPPTTTIFEYDHHGYIGEEDPSQIGDQYRRSLTTSHHDALQHDEDAKSNQLYFKHLYNMKDEAFSTMIWLIILNVMHHEPKKLDESIRACKSTGKLITDLSMRYRADNIGYGMALDLKDKNEPKEAASILFGQIERQIPNAVDKHVKNEGIDIIIQQANRECMVEERIANM